ncbi:hypothetical protein A2U01_0107149, partial [Trifolium medium]|nr:hypothetical protein [Trifolium medium]
IGNMVIAKSMKYNFSSKLPLKLGRTRRNDLNLLSSRVP